MGGGKGALIQDEKSATLSCNNDQTLFAPTYSLDRVFYNQGKNAAYKPQIDEEVTQTVVAKGPNAVAVYGISAKDSNAMKSDNPHSGIYEADTSRTLDLNGGNPGCNQGGMAIVEKPIYHASHGGFLTDWDNGGAADTVLATDHKDPQCISDTYIVRRLTPTECARLQGFPDWWAQGLETAEPTDEDIAFWRDVFVTYGRIYGVKPKSDNQIRKWLKSPHTDSAEYKMWGNGVALPCVYFILAGIAWADEQD